MYISSNKIKVSLLIIAILLLALFAFLLFRGEETVEAEGSGFFQWALYGLNAPHAVTADADGNVYISNTGGAEVGVYDGNGELIRRLEPYDAEKNEILKFYAPYGIAVDDSRNKVYVCDFNWRGVRVLKKDGTILYNLPRDPQEFKAMGADFTPYGVALLDDKVYIAARDAIYVFDSEGKFLDRWGVRGSQGLSFNSPNGIAVDKQTRNLYVADTMNRRLVALSEKGEMLWTIGSPDVNNQIVSPLQLPRSVQVGPDGLIYVADTFAHRLDIFDKEGNLVSLVGGRGTNDGELNFPEGIAFTDALDMYVVDRGNNRVQAWRVFEEWPKPTGSDAKGFENALNRQPTT